ncbi:SAM-dependent methyltransferase [Actinoplanes missouriensis]|uniref:class I SAM-dependent methyltransferase n=1 Tax=Actinoplanes missouriensis TaxID=1866 RepID=UPI0033D88F1D
MAISREARTAVGAGMMRALEGHARRPLFTDPLAERLLSGLPALIVGNRVLRWAFLRVLERAGPGFYGAVVGRTRMIDDACRDALAAGVRQVVLVGAGMDTRPYRMPEMARTRVWELDLPVVQAEKRLALTRALAEPAGHVRYAPLDLITQPVDDVLAEAGADPAAPTLVLCEAVLMYLPDEATDNLIGYAARLTPGSRLVMTYVPRSVHDDPRFAGWRRRLGLRASIDPPELARRLAGCGLIVHADLGADEHRELLRDRRIDVFPGERIVIAGR